MVERAKVAAKNAIKGSKSSNMSQSYNKRNNNKLAAISASQLDGKKQNSHSRNQEGLKSEQHQPVKKESDKLMMKPPMEGDDADASRKNEISDIRDFLKVDYLERKRNNSLQHRS